MTRLLTCGYETGDLNEAGSNTITAPSSLTVVNTAPTPRAGAYCLKALSGSSTFPFAYKTFTLPASKTELWIRFAVFIHPASMTTEIVFAGLQDATGANQQCLTWDGTSNVIRARNQVSASGVLLGTGGTILPPDTWHVIEWRSQILTTTTGTTEVWLDGNRIINFSGDNSGTTTLNMQFLMLGNPSGGIAVATGTYLAYDDIAVNDVAGTVNNGRPQDGRIILLTPSGAGSSTQFVRGGTDTGANYSQVNELPPSMGQYVGSPTVGQRDLYAMADVGVAVSSISVVEAIALAQNSDAGGGSIGLTVKSGATTNEATAIGLSTSAGYVTSRWETDPNTTAAWTIAAVNAIEAGVTVR